MPLIRWHRSQNGECLGAVLGEALSKEKQIDMGLVVKMLDVFEIPARDVVRSAVI